MKIVLLAASLMGYSFVSCSQDVAETDVPSLVKNAFTTQFSNATDVTWEKEKSEYEVEFTQAQTEYSAQFNESGKLLWLETDMAVAQIPAAVLKTITASYSDKKINEAEKIIKDGKTYYEIELDGTFFGKEVIVSEDGAIAENLKF